MLEAFLPTLVTLLVLVDPIAIVPIFIALTPGLDSLQRRRIAVRAVITATGILVVFALAGAEILQLFGIGLPAFRVSGGLMLLLIAIEMLFEKRSQRRSNTAMHAHESDHPQESDPSIFPLALPLLAGPGAIATVILLMNRSGEDWGARAVVLAALATAMALTMIFLLLSSSLARHISLTAVNLLTRILGVILGALAVQFMLDGLAEFGVFTRVAAS
ncbi:MarC family protein [Neomegalonema sp.]|uniref:MarC family protein n=1 Tax=Neomegalonema sp. TaxID=2039713 RepID=UPI0026028DB2|nr:MarC family protein [Neomegalonema sp.]MDD2867013.1 MarC family protein [Neomegalonema sp.]